MSHRTTFLLVIAIAFLILLLNSTPTPAQQAGPYYLIIDGKQAPPQVVSSTLLPVPVVKRRSIGDYEITFRSNFRFLVGTAEGTDYSSSEWTANNRLFAHHSITDLKVWHISIAYLDQVYFPDRYSEWKGNDAQFSIIVRQ